MKNLFKNEMERALKNKGMIIALCVSMAIILLDIYQNAIGVRLHMSEYQKTYEYQTPGLYNRWIGISTSRYHMVLNFIFPILISLPYTISIYTDIKRNYINNVVTRIEKKYYFLTKMMVQFISSFLVVAIPLVLSFVITAMILPVEHPLKAAGSYSVRNSSIFGELFYSSPFIYCIIVVLLDSIMYGVLGCIGYIAAYVLDNSLMVVISPFIIYFFEYVFSVFIGKISMRVCYIIPNFQVGDIANAIINPGIIVVLTMITYNIKTKSKSIV